MIEEALLVSWSSKKQPIVTLSTTETEYIATASCACQCIWIQRVLEKLGLKEQKNTWILCDNNSTIQLSKNPVFHGRSKHIDIKDLVKDGIIKLSYCSSQIQVADIMTKPLKLEQFLKLRNMLEIFLNKLKLCTTPTRLLVMGGTSIMSSSKKSNLRKPSPTGVIELSMILFVICVFLSTFFVVLEVTNKLFCHKHLASPSKGFLCPLVGWDTITT
ncbi:hypothetical protein CR513_17117, partial [Mucuna pruriens]